MGNDIRPLYVERTKLVAWLRDKSRDEDETAEHCAANGDSIDVVYMHRDKAKTYRSVAAGVERGDPDDFIPPDLASPKRQSGEHALDFGALDLDDTEADTEPEHPIDPMRRR